MKTITFTLALTLTIPAVAQTNQPPIDNFVLVTNLWYNGYKSNVLAIAEQRLAVNSNDLAGLFLKLDYDIEFVNTQSVVATIPKILSLVPTINAGHFLRYRDEVLSDYQFFLNFILHYYHPSPDELCEDRLKGFIPEKPLPSEKYMKALHDDGLF